MTVWQSADTEKWYVTIGSSVREFTTEREARVASKKTQFATDYAKGVQTLLDTLNTLGALKAEFLALDYATAMTDADVAPLGIVVADLYAAAGAVDAINATVATGTNAKALYTVGS